MSGLPCDLSPSSLDESSCISRKGSSSAVFRPLIRLDRYLGGPMIFNLSHNPKLPPSPAKQKRGRDIKYYWGGLCDASAARSRTGPSINIGDVRNSPLRGTEVFLRWYNTPGFFWVQESAPRLQNKWRVGGRLPRQPPDNEY